MSDQPPPHDATQAIPAFNPAPPPPEHGGPAYPPQPQPAYPQPAYAPQPEPTSAAPQPQWGQPDPAPAPVAPAPPRRSGRVLGRALLVLLVIGALAGTTAWGFVNRSSAEEWRDRAEGNEEDLRTALDRVDETQGELDDATERLRDLANESAGETDRNRILQELVAQAPDVTAALADCQQLTADLANDLIQALEAATPPDQATLQDQADEVNDTCEDALSQAQALQDQIDALGI